MSGCVAPPSNEEESSGYYRGLERDAPLHYLEVFFPRHTPTTIANSHVTQNAMGSILLPWGGQLFLGIPQAVP